MKKSRFTESQIIKAVKDYETGRDVNELCRELGIHRGTFYFWKKKYGGMEVQELKRLREPLVQPELKNSSWSMDFMSDSLQSGQRFRTLNILDDFNREVLHIEIGTSLPSLRVVRLLEELKEWRGLPGQIRVDNGPEFIAGPLRSWAEANGVRILFIQPGKPTQNAYVERFNKTFRTEVLDYYSFISLNEVREITREWMEDYNHHRPHGSLRNCSPIEFAEQWALTVDNFSEVTHN